jgi:dUTP pyrophosphatase|tara:strand:+ start:1599 stop:2066 length:468 start_codon:yes stop_codon:yes gene_type:complete
MFKKKYIAINIIRVSKKYSANFPTYQTMGASGVDLIGSPDISDAGIVIKPGQREIIPTGIAIELPEGLEAQVRPRSGIAYKYGVTVLNSPGTIDSDYRGEIKVILINHGQKNFVIKSGDRIAQMIVSKVEKIEFSDVEKLSRTNRNNKGFGSTGV